MTKDIRAVTKITYHSVGFRYKIALTLQCQG